MLVALQVDYDVVGWDVLVRQNAPEEVIWLNRVDLDNLVLGIQNGWSCSTSSFEQVEHSPEPRA